METIHRKGTEMKAIIGILFLFILLSCKKTNDFPVNKANMIPYSGIVDTIETTKVKSSINLIENGGGQNTTDWVDKNKDGLGDGWSKDYPGITHPSITKIKNGTPFTGRYQNIINIEQFRLSSPTFKSAYGKHLLHFKYETNCESYVCIKIASVAILVGILTPGERCVYYTFTSEVNGVIIYSTFTGTSPYYLSIDNVNLMRKI